MDTRHKTIPQLQAMTAEQLKKEHIVAERYAKKVRREIRERRRANTPPGFVPKPTTTPES